VIQRGSEHEAGDITTGDIGGTALLHTLGGNIKTGASALREFEDARVGAQRRKLETEAATYQVLDVAGDLTPFTEAGILTW